MIMTNSQLLIVDDEPINLGILVELFEEDYEVVVATDGEQALALAHRIHPDLILLDVLMPTMDGYEVCAHLKRDTATKGIPVIFVTGLEEEQAEARGFDSGAVDYVTKPIIPSIVRRRVANHLELKKTRDHLGELAVTLERKNHELLLLRDRDRDDMEIAHNVMNNIIRSDGLRDPDIRYFQRSAQQFSGDFIAAGRDDRGDLRLMLADVTGHGLQAALFLLPIFRIFRVMARKGLPTCDIVTEINRAMREIAVAGHFIAAAIVHISRHGSSLEVWNGGIAAVLHAQDNGEIHWFASRHLPLGLLDTHELDTTTEIFHARSGSIILCSDGLTEAENANGQLFGHERLETILQTTPPDRRLDDLLTAFEAHLGGQTAHDDVSILMASIR